MIDSAEIIIYSSLIPSRNEMHAIHIFKQEIKMDIIIDKEKEELRNSLQIYKELAENSPIGIISCDLNGNITFVNNKVVELLGSPGIEETMKINLFTFPLLVQSGFSDKLSESIRTNSHISYERQYVSKWGKKIWLNIHIKPYISADQASVQIIIDDISEKKNLEIELTTLSFTDPLTGIYNRRYFTAKLEEEIIQAQQNGTSFSVIMFDLDNFKSLNDRFGHDYGDTILKMATEEVMQRIRKEDSFARWGGEEFIILLSGADHSDAVKIAEKLRVCIEELPTPNLNKVTASFGVTAYQYGDSKDSIIQKADNKLYHAKLSGRNRVD